MGCIPPLETRLESIREVGGTIAVCASDVELLSALLVVAADTSNLAISCTGVLFRVGGMVAVIVGIAG